ncbi:MAG: GNAT family N-acetyltransferase [Burkholderiales bacterium]
MNYRRAGENDWSEVFTLQEANLAWNLSAEDRAGGFLSARFSGEQFQAMNTGGAVVVARDSETLAGYAYASTQAFNAGVPIIAAIMEAFARLSLLGRPLQSPATVIYGPVCVERAYRGKGVFHGLIATLKQELRGRYETAAAFIAKSNARSLAAHVQGLGMAIVGDFEFDGSSFWIVAFGHPAGSRRLPHLKTKRAALSGAARMQSMSGAQPRFSNTRSRCSMSFTTRQSVAPASRARFSHHSSRPT